jgi:hypothetical protein
LAALYSDALISFWSYSDCSSVSFCWGVLVCVALACAAAAQSAQAAAAQSAAAAKQAEAAAAQAQATQTKTPQQKLAELQSLYDQKLISASDYAAAKTKILNQMTQ